MVQLSIFSGFSWRWICYFWLLLPCFYLFVIAFLYGTECFRIIFVFSAHCISQQQQYKANKLFDAIRCFEQTLCWFICDNSLWMTIINKIFECERSLAYRRAWMCKQMILNVYVFICSAQGYRWTLSVFIRNICWLHKNLP